MTNISAPCIVLESVLIVSILLAKTTAAQNDVALSYHKVRGLYFLAVVFVRSIKLLISGVFYLKLSNQINILSLTLQRIPCS